MTTNDDRKIWKCKCGFDNKAEDMYCYYCNEHKPKHSKLDGTPTESEFSEDYTENIRGQTYKISECVSHSAIKIQELEKEKAKMGFYNSLIDAVRSAGGSTQWIKEDTTLKELCDALATNNVRFIHNSAANSGALNKETYSVINNFKK